MALKTKPKPGGVYTMVRGDTLSAIALRAFGKAYRWREIWEANKPMRSGSPHMIYPGEVIRIPPKPPEVPETETEEAIIIPNREEHDMALFLNGTEIRIQSGTLVKSLDTVASAWTARIQPQITAEGMKATRPFGYQDSEVYLGGTLQQCGRCYKVSPKSSPEDRYIQLEGYSRIIDAVDSSVNPPYSYKGATLKQLAEYLLEPYGILVEFDSRIIDKPFDKLEFKRTEKIFQVLSEMCSQRGCVMVSSFDGRRDVVLITLANTKAKPVAFLKEGYFPWAYTEGSFDGRSRFGLYTAFMNKPGLKGKAKKEHKLEASVKDEAITSTLRHVAFMCDGDGVDVKEAANWEAKKVWARAMPLTVTLHSWVDDKKNYWEPNTMVNVESSTLYIPNGFNMLIKEVTFKKDGSNATAELVLVPPSAMEGVKDMDEAKDPWNPKIDLNIRESELDFYRSDADDYLSLSKKDWVDKLIKGIK